MANLAIKGHPTRGNEVIEILEMLGGKNDNRCCGGFINRIYLINENGYMESCDRMHHLDYLQLTLEEFLEKFPYKIGDKILYKTYGIYSKIKTMLWNAEKERVFYRLESNKLFVATADELQPYKEETTNKAIFDANAQCCDIMNHLIKKETMEDIIKIDIPKGYEFAGVDDDKQQVVFEKIGYHYPKTYKECCDVLGRTLPITDDVLVVMQDTDKTEHVEIRWRSIHDDVIVDENGFSIYPSEEKVLAWLPIPNYYKNERK